MSPRRKKAKLYKWPIYDEVDLRKVAGTYTHVKTYAFATLITFDLHFTSAGMSFAVFAGEAAALTNGINITYGGEALLPSTIKTNGDFNKYGVIFEVLSGVGNNLRHVHSVIDLTKVLADSREGMKIDTDRTLKFIVGDNLSGVGDGFTTIIAGYRFRS